MLLSFRPNVRVVVGVLESWIDEHNIYIVDEDGDGIADFDLGGFDIERGRKLEGHIEECEDDLRVGDTVMVTVVEHLVVLKRAKKTKKMKEK
jgi:hypothetical protein